MGCLGVAFQLPPGFRPKDHQAFPLVFSNEVVLVIPSTGLGVDEGNAGAVSCGEENCFLNGITFRAES
jgi:hypothetical protein